MIFTGWVGWVCYGMAVLQYLIIGLVTSRDRAIDVLLLFDEQMAARRRELVRQFGVISEFARSEAAFDQQELPGPQRDSLRRLRCLRRAAGVSRRVLVREVVQTAWTLK